MMVVEVGKDDLTLEGGQEFGDDFLQFSIGSFGDFTFLGNLVQEGLFGGLDVLQEFLFELGDLRGIHLIQVTTDTAVDDSNLQERRKKIEETPEISL